MAKAAKTAVVSYYGVNFCGSCEAILPLPNAMTVINCRACNAQISSAAFETTEVNHTVILNTDSHRKREDTGRTQASAPVVDRRCVKCGSEKMEYRTQQTRSADEGQTVFYTCPKCGHAEIEHS